MTTPTASGTPTVTLTPSFTPTTTPSPTPTTEPQQLGDVRLSLNVSPEEVRPGEILTYTIGLVNAGRVQVTHMVISDTLPAGLVYVPDSAGSGQYDPPSRRLTWSLEGLDSGAETTFNFQARVRGDVLDDLVVNHVEVTGPDLDGPRQARATVAVIRQAVIPPEGGVLETPSGRLRVAFPPGAVDRPVHARYTPRSFDRTGRFFALFELTAWEDTPDQAPVTQFTVPVTIIVSYTAEDVQGLAPASLRIVWFDEERGQWVSLPSRVDTAQHTVTAQTDHFSLFGVEGTSGQLPDGVGFSLPTVVGQTGLWTGAATAQIPIQVPPGPGGLTPDLALTYSSDTVVDVRYTEVGNDTDHKMQAAPVGYGWTIEGAPAVVLVPAQAEFNDIYYGYEVSLNGKRFRLAHRGREASSCINNQVTITTHYESYPQYFVDAEQVEVKEYSDVDCQYEIGPVEHKWILRTTDGTTYVFGGSYTGVERNSMQETVILNQGWGYNPLIIRWYLTRIRDTHSNEIYLTYRRELAGGTTGYDQAVTLDTVQYSAPRSDPNDYKFRVRFVPETTTRFDCAMDKDDGTLWPCSGYDYPPYPPVFRSNYLINYIAVEAKANGQWEALRTYDLSYDFIGTTDRAHALLTSVTITRNGQSLPSYTMTYLGQDTPTTFRNWASLLSIDNGYGGRTEFDYAEYTFTVDGGNRTRQRAWHRRVYDRGQLVSLSDYSYSGSLGSKFYATNYGGIYHDWYEFLGHRQVTETLKSPTGTVVRQTITEFVQKSSGEDNNPEPHPARGQVSWRQVRENAAAPVLYQIESTWQTITTTLFPAFDFQNCGCNPPKWGRLEKTVERWDVGQPEEVSRVTTYTYDTSRQGGTQYGNVTDIVEYAGLSDYNSNIPYRTTRRWFYPNATDHIVDRMGSEGVYVGGGWDLARSTWYFYDGNTSPTQSPGSQGALTRVARLEVIDPSEIPGGWTGCVHAKRTSEVEYDYDDYGDPTTETTYAGYGYMCQDGNWNVLPRDPDHLDKEPTDARTTQTGYDDIFHTFAITETNALGQEALTQYYGVNGSPLTAGGAFFGQVEAVTDPNGATTRYEYDAFGRRTQVFRPGDTIATPTTAYTYTDAAPGFTPPLRVQVDRRVDGDTVRTSHYFYDGLGRLIQTKDLLPNNQQAVQHTTYDTQGLVADEYVPYAVPASANYEPLPNPPDSKPGTRYEYDALGRQTLLTHPDDRTVQTGYAGRQTTVADENGHQTVKERDAFGRLVQVEEYTGTGPYTLYATTRYGYDVLDLMTVVTDTTGITTTISYDPLGRKEGMVDPDMGEWLYRYDAVGNLTQQRDARNQAVCFHYDALNRLLGKSYYDNVIDLDGLSCPGAAKDVHYTYDDGAFGKGRRTGMSDAAGFTAWRYDARGRVLTETRRIGVLGVYTTTYTYDSQDRVVTMHYPDPTPDAIETGEVITTTYNIAGQPATLTSSLDDTYVTDATYTPEGRLDVLSLGSNLQINHDYYAWNAPDGRGRLQYLQAGPPANPTSLQNLSYTYDAVGNVQTITDDGQTTGFTYDALDRLRTATGSYTANYTYDTVGNLLTKTEDGTAYTLQYTDPLHAHAPKVVDGATYEYDANGNLITRTVGSDTDSLTYDAESQLHTVTNTTTGETVTFTYDGDGRRVLRDTATETVAYVGPHYELRFTKTNKPEDLDDDCQVTVIDIMRVAARWGQAGGPEDLDGSGTVDAGDIQRVAGQWRETCHVLVETVKYYNLGNRRVAMRKVPAAPPNAPGTLYYLFSDHLGSTSVSYNTTNSQAQSIRYYPYGGTRSGDVPTDRRFTGQRWDGTIDLYDYNARWYDQMLGRFIQPDTLIQTDAKDLIPHLPLAVSYANPKTLEQWNQRQRAHPQPGTLASDPPLTFDPQLLNRYTYARNNPLAYTDPGGDFALPVPLVTGLIGAAAGGLGYVASVAFTDQDFNLRSLAVATGVGFVAGAAAPIVAIETFGALALGATANVTQYALTQIVNDQPLTLQDAAINTAAGVVGGAIAGPYTTGPLRASIDLARARLVAPQFYKEVSRQILQEDVRLGVGTFVRSFTGSTIANYLPSLGNPVTSFPFPAAEEPVYVVAVPVGVWGPW